MIHATAQYFPDSFGCGIPVKKEWLDPSPVIKACKDGEFTPKSEFHITILGSGHASVIRQYFSSISAVFREKEIAALQQLIDDTTWDFDPLPRWYHIARDFGSSNQNDIGAQEIEHRESIIQLVSLPALEGFFQKLRVLIKRDISTQFPHVTLCTRGSDSVGHRIGIPINSYSDFKRFRVKETFPTLLREHCS